MPRLLTVIVIAFVIGAAGGLAALLIANPPSEQVKSSGTALIGGPFTLTDQNGKQVTDEDFRGRHMLVFFGFTHCPDICPAELQVMAAAMDELGDKAKEIVPVFISVDPGRDTPEALKAYLSNFGDEFVGLTGTDEQIAKVAKEYRVTYSTHKEESAENYTVDHSAIVYLMGPDGKYLDHFSYGTSASKMAQTLKRYL
ncbi:SCO family protein [Methyloligella sp. 2.7D]|uniref:SCO family protein n=1 Tax=unclassified Methyloligella TaxID=2625955 RepID=UPI00157BD67F|nr:SCO family protein [Methyloligella sp. GL2]QKP76036.1 SCO family protein [Methyloligella sp. GL2]